MLQLPELLKYPPKLIFDQEYVLKVDHVFPIGLHELHLPALGSCRLLQDLVLTAVAVSPCRDRRGVIYPCLEDVCLAELELRDSNFSGPHLVIGWLIRDSDCMLILKSERKRLQVSIVGHGWEMLW
jgi:hypothetical protein